MKQIILLTLVCFAALNVSRASSNITTPTVSGHWTMAGSPYYIFNNISVDSGQSLVIDPGVNVIFRGQYNILVFGVLKAIGSVTSPVVFDVYDTTGWYINTQATYAGGWKGIYFARYNAVDSSAISYCDFHHLKYSAVSVYRSLHIDHCNFSNNKGSACSLTGAPTGVHELNDCNFFNNYAAYGSLVQIANSASDWYLHDNTMHHNIVGHLGSVLSCQNSTLLFSKNTVNNNAIPPQGDSSDNAMVLSFQSFNNVPCYAVLVQNKVYANTLLLSAPVYCNFAIVDIYRNYICNNNHTDSSQCAHTYGGGGLYLVGNGDYNDSRIGGGVPSLYTVRDNIIANNYSPLYGGGISIYNAKTLVANNTIVNNKAPRGGGIDLFMIDKVSVCVRNNILSGNVNEAIMYGVGSTNLISLKTTNIKYDHNWIAHSFSADLNIPIVPGGSVNIVGDTNSNVTGVNPGLVSPTLTSNYTENAMTADFGLSASSACINAGTNAAVTIGSADYPGNNRSRDSVDIGAYEYNALSISSMPAVPADTMFKYCCMLIAPPPVQGVSNTQSGAIESIGIYPNPASNIVFINTPIASGEIHIADVSGKEMMSRRVTGRNTSFDIHQLPRGIYYAMWYNDSNTFATRKIIVE